MRRPAIVLATIVIAASVIVAPAAPASAATPQCTALGTGVAQFSPPGLPPLPVPTIYYYPAASSGSSMCWMQRGNHSWGVWALQLALNLCYGQGLSTDADFGAATERALRFAQSISGATVDGGYGPNTRTHMKYAPPTLGTPYCAQLLVVGIA